MSIALNEQRWLARFYGEFFDSDGATRMGKTDHAGPLRVQRPFYPEGDDLLHLYLLHPPGGLVAGDKLSIHLVTQPHTKLLVTTPSAGKIYNNITELSQGQEVEIRVANNSSVEWLPMETILFTGAKGIMKTGIHIQGDGLYSGWEIVCLGRPHGDELFESGSLKQSLSLYQDEQPLFKDQLDLSALAQPHLSIAGLQNKTVFGTFVINRDVDFDYSAWLEWFIQENELHDSNEQFAMTQKPGVFIARYLGENSESARNAFEQLWAKVRPLVLDRPACRPRIWDT